MARKRAENREGSLGFPGVVKPEVYQRASKPLGKERKITRVPRERDTRTHLKEVSSEGRERKPASPKEGEALSGWYFRNFKILLNPVYTKSDVSSYYQIAFMARHK
ncbi:hypothetical protein TNCV_422611 [Trichonephila clavipes]|nr:hypothetical protein TNCV_422611 [Trichonephila clavipes]